MKITVYRKKITMENGKSFYAYSTKIHNKLTDEMDYIKVHFTEDAGEPKNADFPLNIEINDKKCNISERDVEYDKNGETILIQEKNLWIKEYVISEDIFEDDSLNPYI